MTNANTRNNNASNHIDDEELKVHLSLTMEGNRENWKGRATPHRNRDGDKLARPANIPVHSSRPNSPSAKTD